MAITNSFVQVAEGVGKFLRAVQRSVGGQTVQVQGVFIEELPYGVSVIRATGISLATAASHVLQITAGVSTTLYIHRIRVYQLAQATSAARDEFVLVRLTTAGTGGGAVTPQLLDTTDAAVTIAAMTLPTAKGTEGAIVDGFTADLQQTVPASPAMGLGALLADLDWRNPHDKKPRIVAGITNGIALKNLTARAAATVVVIVEVSERDH